jgi:acetylornithine/succinyldiaminopimelate/putrescine aminotransferase
MLRADWAPDQDSPALSQGKIRAQGLYLIVDEGTTGLRLARGGAVEHFGLTPDAALYGPALAGGLEFAALAGRGQAPAPPKQEPTPESLAAVAATLDLARELDIPDRLAAWGHALALGLDWFAQRAGVADKLAWEGPLALPRLKGKRLWAFLELCREEGLAMSPLVLLDPSLDPALAPELLWTRLCRAVIRLKALPEGDKAPQGWSEAHAWGSCSRTGDLFDAF